VQTEVKIYVLWHNPTCELARTFLGKLIEKEAQNGKTEGFSKEAPY